MLTTSQDRSWHSGTFVAVIVLLVLVSFATRCRLDPVEPRVANTPSSAFSAVRAAKTLSYILGDERPHPVDSAANQDVRQRIVAILSGLGYQVDVQDTISCNASNYSCARVRNIIAVREASGNGRAIVVSAHYDSVPAGPGASDDGAGVAALLEIARLIKQAPLGKNEVIFLFTDGEEAGLLGASAFASQHALVDKVASVINLEARGVSGQSTMFETGDSSGWLVDEFASTSRRPLTNSLLNAVYKLMPNDTDLSVFKARGLQGLNFAFGEQQSYYHTPLDNLSHLDLGSLQQQGDNVYDLLESLVDADLPAGNVMGNVVYTDILGLVVLRWPVQWGPAVAIVLIVVFALACWRLRKQRVYGRSGIAFGLLGFIASPILGAAVAYALTYVLAMFRGSANAWHAGEISNRVMLWSAVLLVVVSVQRLLARRSDPVALWVGLGWAWLFMALLTAIVAPGASYLFLLPAAAIVIVSLAAPALSQQSYNHHLYGFLAFPALAGFVVIIPAIYLIEIMIGFNGVTGVVAMGGILGLAATFVIPFAQSGQGPRTHAYVACVALIVVVVAAALSLRAPAHTAAQPQLLNVMYVQDGSGKAMVAAGNVFNRPHASVLQAMGSKAALRAIFPWNRTRFYSAPVASAELPVATLTILDEGKVSRGREITARIDADPSASVILVLFPKSSGLRSIEMGGQRLDYLAATGNYFSFTCRGVSCNGRRIKMILHDAAQPVTVVAASVGVPESADAILRSRGAQATPHNDGDQSLVMNEVHLYARSQPALGGVRAADMAAGKRVTPVKAD